MIVSHRYRFIFLRTEKTGGTALSHALADVLGPEDIAPMGRRPAWARYSPIHHGALKRSFPRWFGLHEHATARQVRSVVGREVFDSYFKVVVERNPWDRQVSLYTHREWKKGRTNTGFDRDMRSAWYRNTEYCRLDNWSVYAIGREIVADRVLRYDRLAEDLPPLLAELGVPPVRLPRMRAYDPSRPHYSTFYSDRTRALVARWYANEIEAFGFRFETASEAATNAGEPQPGAAA